jgi:hypothetical protein
MMMLISGLVCCLSGALLIGLSTLMYWFHGQWTAFCNRIPLEMQSMMTTASPQAARSIAFLRLLPLLRRIGLGAGALLILIGLIVYHPVWFFVLVVLLGAGLYSLRNQIGRRFSVLMQQKFDQAIRPQI